MRILKTCLIIITLLVMSNQLKAQVPQRSGWWKFDDASSLLKAENGYGTDLKLVGSHAAATGPEAGNGAVRIGTGSFYKMEHHIPGNGGGSYVNEYSLQFDFKVPDIGVWHSFFQTAMSNNNDGDFFINPSGNIGVAAVGYSVYSILPDEWYRVIISVKNGSHFTCYLDGKPLISGNIQAIDDRFSLESTLLVFADEDGEDADIICSELSIWDQALTLEQATELGGFGHNATSFLMTRIPYLQGQGPNTMTVCWHDIAQNGTKVHFGSDSVLSMEKPGTSEMISDPYRWHTVKLDGLQPNTHYFYQVESGSEKSDIYSFKTLPDSTYTGKLRFVLLSDTHASDTLMAGKVLRATRAKISELYGKDIENHVNGIFHSGDVVVSGSTPGQYTKQYFKPLSALSVNIPTMVVAGNHEIESPYFYQYLKLDEQSAFPQIPALKEKVWQLKVGNSLFIGLNTNIIDQYGETEANWLDTRLNESEMDTTIDFVFLFFHHPAISELWIVGGTDYVKNRLFPVIKKYSKVQQVNYGHTHGFERGTVTSEKPDGDFRMICSGGGGGPFDPWRDGENQDYNDIHKTFNHYFFQILEIDIANQSYQNSMYSLGNVNDPRNSELMDTWYRAKKQSGPETPVTENVEISENHIQFNTSVFLGIDSIMSVHYQLIDSSASSKVLVDSITHWTNIYNVDQNYNPVDLNLNINLYQSKISRNQLLEGKDYFFRTRYRDHNLKWSKWSELIRFNTVGVGNSPSHQSGYFLDQNYPNPFRNNTVITYHVPEMCKVKFLIYDSNYKLIDEIDEGIKQKGAYQIEYKAKKTSSSICFYKMKTNKVSITKKMVLVK